MKYVVVTVGVISGIGKGTVTSSIGALLKACNRHVTAIKIDPYLNIDAGTISPYEHGEVFVLDDGCEVDLDLGNYERFIDVVMTSDNNITTGKIYQRVLNQERQGQYLGKTVQTVPHVTGAIQQWIENTARSDPKNEICIIELGGTIGDIEGQVFIEAIRRLQRSISREDFCCIHVSLVPVIGSSKEPKTKPTQMSVSCLRSYGLIPDIIICRSSIPIGDQIKAKISEFCGVELDRVFGLPELKSIYEVPVELHKQSILAALAECLNIRDRVPKCIKKWSMLSHIALNAKEDVSIAIVGKYTSLGDSYLSVVKSLEHACYQIETKPLIRFIDASSLEQESDNQAWQDLRSSQCILVPGGFGVRGVEGKIAAIKYARTNGKPFLGICLGFQMAVVEYARSVLGIDNANSMEFSSEDSTHLIIEMLEYKDPENRMGGTMRLGSRQTQFVTEDSILWKLYGKKNQIHERHRHRYEVNPDFIEPLERSGLKFVGKNEDGTRMEILELSAEQHPYFVAVQFHPEYLSRPFHPSPPYVGLVQKAQDMYLSSR